MKKTFIVVAVIILVAVIGIFAVSKKDSVDRSLATYSHSSGAFAFKYPESYLVTELEGAALIQTAPKNSAESVNPLKAFASLQAMYYPNYMTEITRSAASQSVAFRNVTLNGNTFKVISFSDRPQYGSKYIMALEGAENPSTFLIGSGNANTEGFTDEKFEEILKTLTIDKSSLIALAMEQASMMQKKALEAKMKAQLANMRPSAEIYYDTANSYTGLCSPASDSQGAALLKTGFTNLKSDAGKENVVCYASMQAYAISVRLPSGQLYCADSTGKMEAVGSAITGTSCK